MARMKMNTTILLVLLCMLVGLGTGVGFGLASGMMVQGGQIPPGAVIENIEVGSDTKSQAMAKLQPLGNQLANHRLTLALGEKTWDISLKELGIFPDIAGAVEKAYQIGREGSIWQRWLDNRQTRRTGKHLELEFVVDEEAVGKAIQTLTKNLVTPAADANFRVLSNDTIEVVPERPGQEVDLRDATAQIKEALAGLKKGAKKKIALRLVEVRPSLTAADVSKMQLNRLLSSFTTQFDATNVNRTYNIKVAAEALNQQVIKPGETFSFNAIVGPRSSEAGYKEALVIVKNEFVPGLGGGVCQVSSTLYNAVLRANLAVTERRNHSLPVTYVPAGLDATVTYGIQDLKFVNNTDGHLLLRTEVNKNTLTVKIFGSAQVKPDIQLINTIIKTIEPKVVYKENPALAEGKQVVEQKGLRGYQTQVYRVVRLQGREIKRELISTDTYQPLDQVIQVGMKKPVPPEPKPGEDQPPTTPPTAPPPGTDPKTPPAESEDKSGNTPGTTPGTTTPGTNKPGTTTPGTTTPGTTPPGTTTPGTTTPGTTTPGTTTPGTQTPGSSPGSQKPGGSTQPQPNPPSTNVG